MSLRQVHYPRVRALGVGIVIAILAIIGMIVFTGIILIPSYYYDFVSTPYTLFALIVGGQFIPFLGFSIAILRYYRRLTWEGIHVYLGIERPTLRELVVVGSCVFFISIAITFATVIISFIPSSGAATNRTAAAASSSSVIALFYMFASLLIIAPCEETLFRGIIQGRLRETFSAPTAISVAALIFATVHIIALIGDPTSQLIAVAVLTIPSFGFGIVYEYTGNLVVPVLTHGLWNAFLFGSFLIA